LPKGIVINTEPSDLSATLAAPSEPAAGSEHDQISQNIEAVLEFYAREELKISHSQRFLERISEFIGVSFPRFFVFHPNGIMPPNLFHAET
jgi:hypothetical protein